MLLRPVLSSVLYRLQLCCILLQ